MGLTSGTINKFQSNSWDGKNKSGIEVATGIYFMIVSVGADKPVIRKIALVK